MSKPRHRTGRQVSKEPRVWIEGNPKASPTSIHFIARISIVVCATFFVSAAIPAEQYLGIGIHVSWLAFILKARLDGENYTTTGKFLLVLQLHLSLEEDNFESMEEIVIIINFDGTME